MSILSIDLTGTIRCSHTDDVADVLRDMGILDVQRASNIEFDNAAQGWLVQMTINSALGIASFSVGPFQRREEALRWETVYLSARLLGKSDAEACKLASKEAR